MFSIPFHFELPVMSFTIDVTLKDHGSWNIFLLLFYFLYFFGFLFCVAYLNCFACSDASSLFNASWILFLYFCCSCCSLLSPCVASPFSRHQETVFLVCVCSCFCWWRALALSRPKNVVPRPRSARNSATRMSAAAAPSSATRESSRRLLCPGWKTKPIYLRTGLPGSRHRTMDTSTSLPPSVSFCSRGCVFLAADMRLTPWGLEAIFVLFGGLIIS